jgi:hypothetical protein
MNLLLILAPAVSAFFGSGIATAVVTHHLTIRRSREELLRSKLEELFLAASGFCMQVIASSTPYLSAMSGKITYDQANDISTKGFDPSQRYFEKSQMLINLYFPEIRDLFDRLIEARDKAGVNARSELTHFRSSKIDPGEHELGD